MFSTKNNVYLRLRLDGTEIDFDRVTFQHVTLRSHPHFALPTLEALLIDPSNFFTPDKMPADGMLVEVVMARAGNDAAEWVPFRIFRPTPKNDEATVRTVRISAYFDAPKYLFDQVSKTFKGTASSVVQQVAAYCNLSAEVDASADDQTWRCGSSTLSEFLMRVVAPAAWTDQQSAYSLAYSHVSKTFKFKNLARLVQANPKYKMSDDINARPDYLIAESEPLTSSGLLNMVGGGYGLVSTGYDFVKGSVMSLSGVEVARAGGRLAMNSKMLGSRAKQIYAPLNFGNTHENFDRAKGQNLRILSTFSQSYDVLVRGFTEVDLYDPISLSVQTIKGKAQPDDTSSSTYVAMGKAQMVTPNEYVERISLIRNSYDNDSGELI